MFGIEWTNFKDSKLIMDYFNDTFMVLFYFDSPWCIWLRLIEKIEMGAMCLLYLFQNKLIHWI